jgi:hypothetical protein
MRAWSHWNPRHEYEGTQYCAENVDDRQIPYHRRFESDPFAATRVSSGVLSWDASGFSR